MSKLIVEICSISEVINHPNAKKLDIVKVKGWQCIVGRGQYKVYDLVVYCPPDSIIPADIVEKYKLEFLKKNGRVGSIKLRGELSQGLILDPPQGYLEGTDVAEILGIIKYEVPEPTYCLNNGQIPTKKKSNPLFDKYTDIENINNFNTVIQEGEEVIITEKIHGCNARYGNLPRPKNNILDCIKALLFGGYEFVYGSHTVQKKWTNIHKGFYKDDVWGIIAKRYKMQEWIPKDYIIYGEIYGAKIQDLTYGLKDDIDFIFFDIKYKGKYLSLAELTQFEHYYLQPRGIKLAPILFIGKYNDSTRKTLTTGFSKMPNAENQIREGCVIKPTVEREAHMGRVILKSINHDYLTRKSGTEFK